MRERVEIRPAPYTTATVVRYTGHKRRRRTRSDQRGPQPPAEEPPIGTITQEQIAHEIMEILDETFEQHHGIYLDRGTGLLQTLAGISHTQASQTVGAGCATVAAQVAHVTFYLEVLERYIVAGDTSKADWGDVWRTVSAVTADEWDALRAALEQTYRRIAAGLRDTATWASDPHLASALAITVHSAYHLGEIRQALCTLR